MNLDWLHRRRISHKCYPYLDKPTSTHYWGWVYENGTTERYNLFSYRNYKITSRRSMYWHLSVLYWINSKSVRKYEPISDVLFLKSCQYIANKLNGFTDLSFNKRDVESMGMDVLLKKAKPPNKKIKFVFKDGTGISFKEKMSIIGSLSSSKKTSKEEIVKSMYKINSLGQRVTNKSLSLMVNCSEKTIQRSLTKELKIKKKALNDEMVQQRKLPKV